MGGAGLTFSLLYFISEILLCFYLILSSVLCVYICLICFLSIYLCIGGYCCRLFSGYPGEFNNSGGTEAAGNWWSRGKGVRWDGDGDKGVVGVSHGGEPRPASLLLSRLCPCILTRNRYSRSLNMSRVHLEKLVKHEEIWRNMAWAGTEKLTNTPEHLDSNHASPVLPRVLKTDTV